MPRIKVGLKNNPYDIIIGRGVLSSLGRYLSRLGCGSDAFVITNSLIKNKHGKELSAALSRAGFSVKFKLIPDTEKSKSIEMAQQLISALAGYDLKKRPFIIAFGGGVVGDLAGFVASIYKRGINYIQVPTTLLAQVDSAIGGKTAVDLAQAKNLVGAFYQPRLVLSDSRVLGTLSSRQLRAGLAEVIKYAIIRDKELFAYLQRHLQDILELKSPALEHIVERSSQIKAAIVAADEKEVRGIRTVLNFGHTLGHAIEAAAGYTRYSHGEAVALGMLAASAISRRLGLLDEATGTRIEALIKRAGLPVKIKGVGLEAVIRAHYRDKKFTGKKNKLVLITGIGRTKIVNDVSPQIIKSALKDISL